MVETNKDSELLKQKIKTALESSPRYTGQAEFIEGYSTYLAAVSSGVRLMMSDARAFKAWVDDIGIETSEYDQETLKWIRYRQSRSKSIDEVVKSKDMLARLIKEGRIDIDHVMNSAVEGDVQSIVTIVPYWDYSFQSFKPSWWERFIDFLLRRKIDANPS